MQTGQNSIDPENRFPQLGQVRLGLVFMGPSVLRIQITLKSEVENSFSCSSSPAKATEGEFHHKGTEDAKLRGDREIGVGLRQFRPKSEALRARVLRLQSVRMAGATRGGGSRIGGHFPTTINSSISLGVLCASVVNPSPSEGSEGEFHHRDTEDAKLRGGREIGVGA